MKRMYTASVPAEAVARSILKPRLFSAGAIKRMETRSCVRTASSIRNPISSSFSLVSDIVSPPVPLLPLSGKISASGLRSHQSSSSSESA